MTVNSKGGKPPTYQASGKEKSIATTTATKK